VTQLERASFVQFLSSGVDHVRFEEIPASIAVAGNAGGYAQAMAEHAVAMMLSLAKRLSAWNEAMARGDFAQDEARTTRLSGKTACVLGLGGVGAAVSGIAYAMGMRVVGVNRTGSSQLHGLSKVSAWSSLDEELPGADVLMIALPLTRATRGCFDSRRLSLMKSDAILVNVGRAEIVDERALFSHLLGNPDFRAGIDVWWREPFKDGYVDACSLMPRLSNVLATPHVAARVEDGLLDGARCAAENIRRFLAGSRPHGLVNRDDY
jgi:glycerate dehydrogenase